MAMFIRIWTRWGPLYWNSTLYRVFMWCIRSSGERTAMLIAVAGEIERRSVLDLCCGPGTLRQLLPTNVYVGIDVHPGFARELALRGGNVICQDITEVVWPSTECLVMVDSLYQFLGRDQDLWDRFRAFAGERVIISETVENWLPRLPSWLAGPALWATRVNGHVISGRYTEETFRTAMTRAGFQRVYRVGHNCIGVWDNPLSERRRFSQTPDTVLQSSAN